MNARALLVGALTATTVLVACAQPQEPRMRMGDGQMSMGDMGKMCDQHQKMMTGKSAQEQQAIMEQQMKAMYGKADPETVARHREMMEKNCPGRRQGMK